MKYDSIKSRSPQRKIGDKMGQNETKSVTRLWISRHTGRLNDASQTQRLQRPLVTCWLVLHLDARQRAQGRLVLAEYEHTN